MDTAKVRATQRVLDDSTREQLQACVACYAHLDNDAARKIVAMAQATLIEREVANEEAQAADEIEAYYLRGICDPDY